MSTIMQYVIQTLSVVEKTPNGMFSRGKCESSFTAIKDMMSLSMCKYCMKVGEGYVGVLLE